MRSVIIALLIVIAFAGGRFLMLKAEVAQHRQDAIHEAVSGVMDCHKEVYEKKKYAPIQQHLGPPENEFWPTEAQLAEDSVPSVRDRKLLRDYETEVTACRTKGIEKIQASAPQLVPQLTAHMDKSNDITNRLIDGKLSWGEAAHLSDNLRGR